MENVLLLKSEVVTRSNAIRLSLGGKNHLEGCDDRWVKLRLSRLYKSHSGFRLGIASL